MKPSRYTIAVDFDGVLHSYTTPWIDEQTIPDPPVEGAIVWLRSMLESGFDVVIHTTRGRTAVGRDAVHLWLVKHWPEAPLTRLQVTSEKPPALAYLDDRAIRFTGPASWPTREQILQARPWNKPAQTPCTRCNGCGKIANDDEGTPWTDWTSLPLHSAIAVVAGIVQPLTCPLCNGTGKREAV